MSTAVDRHPMTFAGFPGSSWAFAIRIWLAIVIALYVSFWLELEAPSSAAVTVAILALPTRGQVLGKAVFRLMATVLGVTASIVIVGTFAQTEVLLLLAFAAWLGLCVYAVGLLLPLIRHAADVARRTRTEPNDGATVEARRARASDLSRAGRLAI